MIRGDMFSFLSRQPELQSWRDITTFKLQQYKVIDLDL